MINVRNALVYALPHIINNNLKLTKMPKVKTNSGAKKRFRFTGTGKIKRHHAYHSHILTKKTKKQKRNLVHQTIVDNSNLKQVRDLLCLR
ncbi:ribosomal protein L35 [Leyella stercorea DSM 18206]|jgi:large subunit ribosomal protein L35|nr:ribosomal protein L35 [Leyella stercorea DSM 18206]